MGLVAIDRDAATSKSYLVHKVTLEKTELASSSFSLHFDEDGVVALVNDDSQEVYVLDDILRKQLVYCNQYGYCVWGYSKSTIPDHWSSSTKLRSCEDLDIVVYSGPTNENHNMKGSLLQWPRQGARVYVHVLQLYSHRAMTSYMGVASKWCYQGFAAWQRW